MKKIFTTILTVACSGLMAVGQNALPEAAPVGVIKPPSLPQINAQFDVLFNYAMDTITGNNAKAGIAYINNEYWVSRWSADSLFTLDASGNLLSSFTITGVGTTTSGTRALTTDGVNLYAAVNTNSIKKIDPVTKTLIGTISCASTGQSARSLSYDPTADGGAGGFWLSNFATDIYLISMTGAVLNTISAGTHSLTAMYGTAVDNISAGGPYLWVFDQAYSAEQSDIVQIDIATGSPTGISYDVFTNVALAIGDTNGLAGGIFISPTLHPSGAILALLQGSPSNRLVGLDLGVTVGVNELNSNNDPFLTLHQNPAKDFVMVEFENYSKGKYTLEITDMSGKVVFEQKQIVDEYTTVDVTGLSKGMYLVRALGNHKVSTKKLIVE